MREALKGGEEDDAETIDDMMAEIDKNKDGKLQWREFAFAMLNDDYATLFSVFSNMLASDALGTHEFSDSEDEKSK